MSTKGKFVDLDVEGAEIVQQLEENPETTPSDYSDDTNADPEGVATRNNEEIVPTRAEIPIFAIRNYELSDRNVYGYSFQDNQVHLRPKASFLNECLNADINFAGIVDISEEPNDSEIIHGMWKAGRGHQEAVTKAVDLHKQIVMDTETDERFQYIAALKQPAEYHLAKRAMSTVLHDQELLRYGSSSTEDGKLTDQAQKSLAMTLDRKITSSGLAWKYATIYSSMVKENGGTKAQDMGRYFYIERSLKKVLQNQAQFIENRYMIVDPKAKRPDVSSYSETKC